MARRREIVRGTARDLAEQGTGYAANGESQFTRNVSQTALVRLPGAVPKTRGPRSHFALIAQNTTMLAKLRGDLLISDDPAKRAKISKNIGIKERFLARLRNEIQ